MADFPQLRVSDNWNPLATFYDSQKASTQNALARDTYSDEVEGSHAALLKAQLGNQATQTALDYTAATQPAQLKLLLRSLDALNGDPAESGSVAPAAPSSTAPGGSSSAAPLKPFVASNLPPGIDATTDQMVRTVYGEARGESPTGQQAVASVIRNRAQQSGMDPTSVMFAPGQFEPWNNPKTRAMLESLDPASPEYQAILRNIRPTLDGTAADPTGGATHFYSPSAQAALGRPAPSWGQGPGQVIGGHQFYKVGYAPGSGAPGAPPAPAPVTGPQAAAGPAPADPSQAPDGPNHDATPAVRAFATAIMAVPAEQRAALYQGLLPAMKQAGAIHAPEQYPGDPALTHLASGGDLSTPPPAAGVTLAPGQAAAPGSVQVAGPGAPTTAQPAAAPAPAPGHTGPLASVLAAGPIPQAATNGLAGSSFMPAASAAPPQPLQADAAATAAVRRLAAMASYYTALPDGKGARAAAAIQTQLDNIAGPGGIVDPRTGIVYRVPGADATRFAASRATAGGKVEPETALAANKAVIDQGTHRANSGVDVEAERDKPTIVAPGSTLTTPRAVGVGGPVMPGEPVGSAQPSADATTPPGRPGVYQSPQANPGPYQGNATDAQNLNVLLRGDPASPEYASAFAQIGAEKVQADGTRVRPDMTPYRTPTFQPPGGASATPGAVGAPTSEAAAAATPGGTNYGRANETAGDGKMSGDQANAALYSDRMAAADQIIAHTSDATMSREQRMKAGIPLVGNYLASSEYQQGDQAQRDFVNAALRRESGAAIAPSEFESAQKQYFPQPGDKPEVLKQKADNRALAIAGIRRAAGPGYKPIAAQPAASPAPPQSAIQHLLQNPSLAGAFDQKYGAGAAQRALSR